MALKRLFSHLPINCNKVSPLLQFIFQALPGWNQRNTFKYHSGAHLRAQLPAPAVSVNQKDVLGESAAKRIENLNEEMKKKLKILQLEYEVLKQLGSFRIPDSMTDELWLEMLAFPTASARKRYYRYLRKIEVTKISRELKKKKKFTEKENLNEKAEQGESKNTMFMFIRKTTMNTFYYSRLAHAMMFGQPIIFDMSFENYMRRQDVIRLCEQFLMSYGSNKIHRDPFHFILSSNLSNSTFQNCLDNTRINKDHEHFLMTNSNQHYLDLYPKEKLVYLTPDAPSPLQTFDHDAIYIIGGLVDKIETKPITMAKAKREKLKMAKLPLDNFVRWGCGNKSLTLNQVIDILLQVKSGSKWTEAFQHIPQRKIRYVVKD